MRIVDRVPSDSELDERTRETSYRRHSGPTLTVFLHSAMAVIGDVTIACLNEATVAPAFRTVDNRSRAPGR